MRGTSFRKRQKLSTCAPVALANDTQLKNFTLVNSTDLDSVLLYELMRHFRRPGVSRTNQEQVVPDLVSNLICTRHFLQQLHIDDTSLQVKFCECFSVTKKQIVLIILIITEIDVTTSKLFILYFFFRVQ
jgi:hypothetical protein